MVIVAIVTGMSILFNINVDYSTKLVTCSSEHFDKVNVLTEMFYSNFILANYVNLVCVYMFPSNGFRHNRDAIKVSLYGYNKCENQAFIQLALLCNSWLPE